MRNWLVAVLMCFATLSWSQNEDHVAAVLGLYPDSFQSAEAFSAAISRDFTTDEDKVRAVFYWLITHVAYDPDEYKKFNYTFKNYRERNQKEEETRKKIIDRTLKKGRAVCEGYAMVFEKVLGLQGIQNYVVRGDTKTQFKDIGRTFNTNHMWNIAYIDGLPYLFDVTWAAGRYTTKFIKEPNETFYKTEPTLFVNTHYPEMPEDALLPELETRSQFFNKPLIITPKLTLLEIQHPKEGILKRDAYFDSFRFDLQLKADTTISYAYDQESQQPVDGFVYDEGIRFEIPIHTTAKTLLIFMNNKPALGYKIK